MAVRLAILGLLAAAWPAHAEMYCGSANCYDLLGVERASDSATIKKAYRQLALKWHPDVAKRDNEEEATQKFQEIAAAYEVLSRDVVREAYDYYLDHPEERMYNKMRYYRSVYQPKTPLFSVIFGFLLVVTLGQYSHWSERGDAFQKSPQFATMLEAEYLRNCTRGRQGLQSGELNKAKKAAIKEEFLKTLAEDPDCPMSHAKWSNTIIPQVVYHLPIAAVRWVAWRWSHGDEIREEKARLVEWRQKEEEEEKAAAEEEERLAAEKGAQKVAKAKHAEEKRRQEEEKKKRWAEEAAREAEEEEAAEDEESLIVTGKVTSVDELRKKGNFLVEITHGDDETVQVVTEEAVAVGQQATVALEGAELPDGKRVRRSKVAGEWSEGQILKLGLAPAPGAAEEEVEEEAPEPEESAAGGEAEEDEQATEGGGKARQRRKKK